MNERQTTDFGFERVAAGEKARRVREVFDSVADRYDLMNDLMSLGIHRWWKHQAVEMAGLRRGHRVLDLAAGTGDLSARMSGLVGPEGLIIFSDINAAMLAQGRNRMLDRGLVGNIQYLQVDAQAIPVADESLDAVTIGFGLRNVTDKLQALKEMNRVLRPGGRAVILEFSHPREAILSRLYDLYSFTWLPRLGGLVTGDAASYRYLAESIRMHPNQETLKGMMEEAGLEQCEYLNFNGGIVAIHRGYHF